MTVFRMDDGLRTHELKVERLRETLREIRSIYVRCREEGRREPICHAVVANELLGAFGGLLPRVGYDGEYRCYVLLGVDGKVLVYDADEDRVAVMDLAEAVRRLLQPDGDVCVPV